jgi:hypothetical protein
MGCSGSLAQPWLGGAGIEWTTAAILKMAAMAGAMVINFILEVKIVNADGNGFEEIKLRTWRW